MASRLYGLQRDDLGLRNRGGLLGVRTGNPLLVIFEKFGRVRTLARGLGRHGFDDGLRVPSGAKAHFDAAPRADPFRRRETGVDTEDGLELLDYLPSLFAQRGVVALYPTIFL